MELISIWIEIKLFYLQFYYMKNMVENRFDDIVKVIINNGGKIEIDFIEKQILVTLNKNRNLQAPLLLDISLNNNLNRNSSIQLSNNGKDNNSDAKNLRSQQSSQFFNPDLISSFNKKLAYCSNISIFSFYQNRNLRKKYVILDSLMDELKKMRIRKYEKKKIFDVEI